MATSEQNKDRSWGDGGAQLPLVLAEGLLSMTLQFAGNILCGVVTGLEKENIISILAFNTSDTQRDKLY